VNLSDLQNLLDLDYPRDKEFIAENKPLDRWIKPRRLHRHDNNRADSGETYQCDAYYRDCTVVITQHTLDGKAILYMISRLTFGLILGMSIPPWISMSEMWDANYGGSKNKE